MKELDLAEEAGYIQLQDQPRPLLHWKLTPGIAWLVQDVTGDHTLVNIPPKFAAKCTYAYEIRFVQGRSVVEFDGPDGKRYAQPTEPPARAPRKVSERPLREAPGVAPAAAGEPGKGRKQGF